MTLARRILLLSALLLVAMIGTSVPSASASLQVSERPLSSALAVSAAKDSEEPPPLACLQVIATAAATYACTAGDWEACSHVLFHMYIGMTFEEIFTCGKYINDGFYQFLCEADGGTFVPGDPPLCVECGQPGHECITVPGGGGSRRQEIHYRLTPGVGAIGGGGTKGGVHIDIPWGVVNIVPNCWSVIDDNGNIIMTVGICPP